MSENTSTLDHLAKILKNNHRGDYTVPAEGYSHQWLWDSCFTAIGLRHLNVEDAKTEILSLLRGQWSNGMLPHMIFADGDEHRRDRNMWRSWLNAFAPDHIATSGITQPPMLAEAIVRIGEKMSKPEKHTWYQTVFPALIAYHQWLYNERDPHNEGLVLQIHPWETGLDNTPPWMSELAEHEFSIWIRLATKKPVQIIANLFRRDRRFIMPGQRLSIFEGLALFSVQHRLRRKNYSIDKILKHSIFAIEDLSYNCIFMRANQHLINIAKSISKDLPEDLVGRIKKTEDSLELLWDAYAGKYYSRNFITHKLIKVDSIATLLPLYSGAISKERAKQLVEVLKNDKQFASNFPIASVPINSEWFKPHGYWQGPAWLNTNWLIIDGLNRYGYHQEAEKIAKKSVEMVEASGAYEYFSPLDGSPAGARDFSWTAALVIDLLSQRS
jgi:Trehalase